MNELTLGPQPDAPRPETYLNDGPDSLISMLAPKVAAMIKVALESHPDLFNKPEQELHQHLVRTNAQPTPTDNCLRLKFWMEYDRARQAGHKRINVGSITAGICYSEYFYQSYLPNPFKLAWLLCMPTGYTVRAVETLEFGISKMREILDMDVERYGPKAVPAMLKLKMQVTEMMNTWVKGAPVQRTLAVNVNTSQKISSLSTDLSMEELEKRMKALEKRNREVKNLPLEIDSREMND